MKPAIREALKLSDQEIIAIAIMLRDWRTNNSNMRISECSDTDIDLLSAQIKFSKAQDLLYHIPTIGNLTGTEDLEYGSAISTDA